MELLNINTSVYEMLNVNTSIPYSYLSLYIVDMKTTFLTPIQLTSQQIGLDCCNRRKVPYLRQEIQIISWGIRGFSFLLLLFFIYFFSSFLFMLLSLFFFSFLFSFLLLLSFCLKKLLRISFRFFWVLKFSINFVASNFNR